MKRKHLCILAFILICLNISVTCYAVTDAEVKAAVDASSKEAVSGNLFVWFLCAIAFMKVSQKIDSFMSSLGISVGRTGGSLIGEAMVVGRTIGAAFQNGGKFAGFGKSNSAANGTGSAPAGRNGFFGGIGSKVTEGATGTVTGNGTASGAVMTSIGNKMYQNSVGKGGAFATNIISSVARGDINKMGTISGENGRIAMQSYFGYNASASIDKKDSGSSAFSVEHGGPTTIPGNDSAGESINYSGVAVPSVSELETGGGTIPSFSDAEMSGGTIPSFTDTDLGGDVIPSFTDADMGGGTIPSYADVETGSGAVPTFSDIEMGGGRITGIETSAAHPDGIQFVMYDAEKYDKPESKFEIVTAVDSSKWYKQYAMPAVERTPYMDSKGKVQYNEQIVQKVPKAPIRKDKI